ncbi:phage morphogenesis protein [Lichenibacterium ramalinae]|uniref:Phage morphogenesis protein n=1 Tax=Lichenibacterium ramalinae TaxID=2316527 RepID=A0A4Q2R6R3_9HYPH|nr:phage morphogenesis protein [Lichenibacterium ramalinae]
MSGIGLTIHLDDASFEKALSKLDSLVSFDGRDLMEAIATLGESQTRRRIIEEKTAPDGTPWKPNLEGTSILQRSGLNLLASLAFSSTEDEAEWGAAWEFAHIHQEGAVITPKNAGALRFKVGNRTAHANSVTIPARPFIGLSQENHDELQNLLTDYFSHMGAT